MSIIYYYNELNELIQEDNQVLNKTVIYSYDSGGNLVSKLTIPYDGSSQTTITYSYDAVWKDKLVSYNGNQITYDAIGNPLTYNGYTYTWEEGRQLSSIVGNGHNISFKYNDSGIRTEKTVDGVTTKYYLSGSRVILEDNGTDKIYYTYDSMNNLVSMNLNGVEYYYIRNAQGDIIGLFDSNTTQVAAYIYDSWGKLVSIKDQNGVDVTNTTTHIGYKNPYRYRGYKYDSETSLYYLNARYYNPEWGRYLNADALGGRTGILLSHNVFAYSMNNPVNMTDHNGFWPRWLDNAVTNTLKIVTNVVSQIKAVVKEVVSAVKNVVVNVSKTLSSSSRAKNTASGFIDKATEYGANKAAKKTITGWEKFGSITMTRAIREPATISGKFVSGVAPYGGTIIFTGKDIIQDISNKQYGGAGIDLLSGVVGAGFGDVIAMGGEAAIAALGLVGLPAIVGGALAFGLSIIVGVGIDYGSTLIKKAYYRRN